MTDIVTEKANLVTPLGSEISDDVERETHCEKFSILLNLLRFVFIFLTRKLRVES